MENDTCPKCGKPLSKIYSIDFLDEPETLVVSCLCECGKQEAKREREERGLHELKLQILDYIRKNKSVSWAELEYFFERIGFDYRGDLRALSGDCENVVLWDGWNYNALKILDDMIKTGKLRKARAGELVYLLDGKTLNYPLVRQNRIYKTPHWLPMVFEARKK